MQKKALRACIFDMDGVIIDTEHLYTHAEKETCRLYNLLVPENEFPNFKGKTNQAIFSYIVAHYGTTQVSVDELIATKRRLLTETDFLTIKTIEGIIPFLRYARSTFASIGLVTSSRRAWQEKLFTICAIPAVFDVVVTGDDIPPEKGKPDPFPYLYTTKNINVAPACAMVIEDSLNGIVSAYTAGCIPIGITTSFKKEELFKAGAAAVVDSFEELMVLLESRNKI